ncbi:hypothetical protein VSS74_03605 [Conexibacter stalactiti]|uniref:Uncharacterized protein n=1 Tax=Conexibacter stalactiti TaxID=1940611 RepID=A0ABU4HJB8_9ACTN|nr:hypothetical protein [Conexibacter stalactiti]MDW5593408.1 hypothetical protein [Conexibacter stalactiti]MEC5034049.1 hypothetical protein [Conexibacter stalactiti]
MIEVAINHVGYGAYEFIVKELLLGGVEAHSASQVLGEVPRVTLLREKQRDVARQLGKVESDSRHRLHSAP